MRRCRIDSPEQIAELALAAAAQGAKVLIARNTVAAAIATLKGGIDADEAIHRDSENDDEEAETDNPVFLRQRALPVLERLERSLKDNVPVTWGV